MKRRVVFFGYCMFLLSQTIKEENLCTHLVILTKKDRYRYIGYRQKTITKNMAGNTMECNSSYLAMVVGINKPSAKRNAGECWQLSGTTRGILPNEAHPGLHSKPLDACTCTTNTLLVLMTTRSSAIKNGGRNGIHR